jgi:hypothetical protein
MYCDLAHTLKNGFVHDAMCPDYKQTVLLGLLMAKLRVFQKARIVLVYSAGLNLRCGNVEPD